MLSGFEVWKCTSFFFISFADRFTSSSSSILLSFLKAQKSFLFFSGTSFVSSRFGLWLWLRRLPLHVLVAPDEAYDPLVSLGGVRVVLQAHLDALPPAHRVERLLVVALELRSWDADRVNIVYFVLMSLDCLPKNTLVLCALFWTKSLLVCKKVC